MPREQFICLLLSAHMNVCRDNRGNIPAPSAVQGLNQIEDDPEPEDRSTVKKPPKKRRRKGTETETSSNSAIEEVNKASKSVVQRRCRLKGKLARMMEMPVDIFTEVGHLYGHENYC